jgi:Arc/MetJ-type ribon-helix-helix transcriptional regulator
MSTTTVGFAVADEDRPLLDRLVERFGNGNRSEYLRQTLRVMESIAIAEELQELQARSSDRLAAEQITTYEDVLARYPKRS